MKLSVVILTSAFSLLSLAQDASDAQQGSLYIHSPLQEDGDHDTNTTLFVNDTSHALLDRCYSANDCIIANPNPRRFPTCKPLLCDAHTRVTCYRPFGNSCVGHGLRDGLLKGICGGCRCFSMLPYKVRHNPFQLRNKLEENKAAGLTASQIEQDELFAASEAEPNARDKMNPAPRTNFAQLAAPSSLGRRAVMDDCMIVNPAKYSTCIPNLCAAEKDVTCSRPAGIQCAGNGFKLPWVSHICGGCQCRTKPSTLKKLPKACRPSRKANGMTKRAMKEQLIESLKTASESKWLAIPSILERRIVLDDCKITNPDKLPTCRPHLCATQHDVLCSRPAGGHCRGHDFKLPWLSDICGGCRCKTKVRQKSVDSQNIVDHEAPQALRKTVVVSKGTAKHHDTEEAQPEVGSKKLVIRSKLDRRFVSSDCIIVNPKKVPTCKPDLCAAEKYVDCEKPIGKSCQQTGMKVPWLKDICGGCACRARTWWPKERSLETVDSPDIGARQTSREAGEDAQGVVESLVASKAGIKKNESDSPSEQFARRSHLHGRESTQGCEITNPDGFKTCNPPLCNAHPLVLCVAPIGNRCTGHGLDLLETQKICRGCRCARSYGGISTNIKSIEPTQSSSLRRKRKKEQTESSVKDNSADSSPSSMWRTRIKTQGSGDKYVLASSSRRTQYHATNRNLAPRSASSGYELPQLAKGIVGGSPDSYTSPLLPEHRPRPQNLQEKLDQAVRECEITNPRKSPTCDPSACAARGVVCEGRPNSKICLRLGFERHPDVCDKCRCLVVGSHERAVAILRERRQRIKKEAMAAGWKERKGRGGARMKDLFQNDELQRLTTARWKND